MKIDVHIERLVLDGLPVDARQGRIVGEALQTELTQLLTARPISTQLGGGRSVASGESSVIQLAACLDATGLGERIASRVYDNLGGRQ